MEKRRLLAIGPFELAANPFQRAAKLICLRSRSPPTSALSHKRNDINKSRNRKPIAKIRRLLPDAARGGASSWRKLAVASRSDRFLSQFVTNLQQIFPLVLREKKNTTIRINDTDRSTAAFINFLLTPRLTEVIENNGREIGKSINFLHLYNNRTFLLEKKLWWQRPLFATSFCFLKVTSFGRRKTEMDSYRMVFINTLRLVGCS